MLSLFRYLYSPYTMLPHYDIPGQALCLSRPSLLPLSYPLWRPCSLYCGHNGMLYRTRCLTDRVRIILPYLARGCIDNHVHIVIFNEIHNIWPAPAHLMNHLAGYPLSPVKFRRPSVARILKPCSWRSRTSWRSSSLDFLFILRNTDPSKGSLSHCRQFSLVVTLSEMLGYTHNLTG